ncbi:MAG: HAMP domain-containing histidine kinase [Desulfovibrionaceae bacterium]|nr:HAMP domain-containing histidine kinase [Desulfovibrionaceae bacterium]
MKPKQDNRPPGQGRGDRTDEASAILEREVEFYRRQCEDLGHWVLRQQADKIEAMDQARRRQKLIGLVAEVRRRSDRAASVAEASGQFVTALAEVLDLGAAAALRYRPKKKVLEVEHCAGRTLPGSFACPPPPPKRTLLAASGDESAFSGRLAKVMGAKRLVWAYDPAKKTGLALARRAQESEGPGKDDLETVSAVLDLYLDCSERVAARLALDRERRRMERRLDSQMKELQRAGARLGELDDMKSSFLSSVSHELRTPLTSILGFGKLMARDLDRLEHAAAQSGPGAEALNRLRKNAEVIVCEADRLIGLINDVLDLNRIDSRRMRWSDRPVDLARVVDRVVDRVAPGYPGIGFEVRIPDDLPMVMADPKRLDQVLAKLLDNAGKFTPQGRVEVRARRIKDLVRVRVSDTGIGIPKGEMERVFDRLHQVGGKKGLKDKPADAGLGLAICKRIVEHYGGRIWAQSRPGRGSTLFFELPVADPGAEGPGH